MEGAFFYILYHKSYPLTHLSHSRESPRVLEIVCTHRMSVSTHSFGQESERYRRFVQKADVCPYKFEKNSRFFLESEDNRRIFALAKTGCASAI